MVQNLNNDADWYNFERLHVPTKIKSEPIVKWGASSRWPWSSYCPMRISEDMAIGKTHPTLQDRYYRLGRLTSHVEEIVRFRRVFQNFTNVHVAPPQSVHPLENIFFISE